MIEAFELIQRFYDAKPDATRPNSFGVQHTGYIVSARNTLAEGPETPPQAISLVMRSHTPPMSSSILLQTALLPTYRGVLSSCLVHGFLKYGLFAVSRVPASRLRDK